MEKSPALAMEFLLTLRHLIIHNPLFGVGPLNYPYYTSNLAAHPHNSLLLIASELGIPALILIVLLFCFGSITWLKHCKIQTNNKKNTLHNTILTALGISLIAAMIHSLVSGIIVMPLSQIMMCLVIGWMLGIYLDSKAMTSPQKITKRNNIPFISLIIVSIIFVSVGTLPTALHIESKSLSYFQTNLTCKQISYHKRLCYGTTKPYFWGQGFIRWGKNHK